ncbi:MAG: TonB-dependent receptor [Saprospiraceae bacterium]
MTLRYTILLLACCIFSLKIQAQSPFGLGASGPSITGKISGTIIDSLTNQPIGYATIALSKAGQSKSINGTLANDNGSFKLEDLKLGSYQIIISFLGYRDKIIDSIALTGEKPDHFVGKISMQSSDIQLNEVEVIGQGPIMETKIDRFVYNADKDIAIGGGDAADVLRKVPMLVVDMDGNVQLRGSSNIQILINGKPSGTMASSMSDALKMIPADQVKSVEVITSPSAKYDAEGTSGIINIITKKKSIEGFTGSTNISAGMRGVDGSVNANLKQGRVGYTAGLGGRYTFPRLGYTKFYREDFSNTLTSTLSQEGDFRGVRNTYFVNAGIDYDINAFNNISTNAKLNSTIFKGDNDLEVRLIDPNIGLDQNYFRNSTNRNEYANIDWSADYRRTFKTAGQEWTTSAQWSQNQGLSRFDVQQFIVEPNFELNELRDNDSKNRELTFQTDYVHPFKKITLETGAKAIFRTITTDNEFRAQDSSGVIVPIPQLENDFSYNQKVIAGYGVISYKFAKTYEIKGGLRYEHTNIKGDFAGDEDAIANEYQNFLPSVTIAKTFSNFKTLKFSYNQRIQRPSLFYLNPFVNAADPKNISYGNPYLQPEYTNSFELNYSTFFKGTALNVAGFYRNTQDVILNVLTIDDSTSVARTTYENNGLNQTVGVNVFGSWQATKALAIRGSINLYEVFLEGNIEGLPVENNSFQYNLALTAAYTFKNGYSAEFFGLINSPRATLQGTNPTFGLTNLGIKKTIWKKKGSISLNITNPFTPHLIFKSEFSGPTFKQTSENGIPFRSIDMTFNYRFGKLDFKMPQFPGQKKRGVNNDDLKKEEGSF